MPVYYKHCQQTRNKRRTLSAWWQASTKHYSQLHTYWWRPARSSRSVKVEGHVVPSGEGGSGGVIHTEEEGIELFPLQVTCSSMWEISRNLWKLQTQGVSSVRLQFDTQTSVVFLFNSNVHKESKLKRYHVQSLKKKKETFKYFSNKTHAGLVCQN